MFAGGGTGGHLFPGISLAQLLVEKDRHGRILFVGARKEFEKPLIDRYGFDYRFIRQKPLPRSLFGLVLFPFRSLIALVTAMPLVVSFRPDVAVGLGGYGSVIPLFAAHLLGVPLVLLEQNSVPGRANRFLGRWARLVCLEFESSIRYFRKCRCLEVLGNPLRRSLFLEGKGLKPFNLAAGKKTIAVLGGSQGASAINEKIISELRIIEPHSDRIQMIHQTGSNDFERVKEAYSKTSLSAHVADFIDDMGRVYQNADLIVSRAGGTTIAEITAFGVPAILIPFPYAKDNHQFLNAKEVSERKAAVIFEQKNFASASLLQQALDIVLNEEKLAVMKQASKRIGRPDAAEVIADKIWAIAKKE